MKTSKLILTSVLIVATSLTSFAESKTVSGASSGRTQLVAGYDNVLKSGDGDRFDGGDGKIVITSLDSSTNAPAGSQWDFAYGTIIDINSSVEGEVMAFNNSGRKIQWRIGEILIKNSNESATDKTIAKVNFGSQVRFITNNANQSAGFRFATNAKVLGQVSLSNSGGGSNFFIVDKDSTVEYTSGIIYLAARAHLDVNDGAVLKYSASMTAYSGSTINVNTGGTLQFNNSSANIIMDSGSTVNVKSGGVLETVKDINGATMNIDGSLVYTGVKGTFSNLNLKGSLTANSLQSGSNGRIVLVGTNGSTFSDGATVDITGAIELNSTSLTIDADCGDILLRDRTHIANNGTENLYEGRLMLSGDATVTFNKDNAITRLKENGEKHEHSNILITGNNNKINVNAIVKCANLRVYGGETVSADLDLVLSNSKDDVIIFTAFTSDSAKLTINIENFENERIFVKTEADTFKLNSNYTIKADKADELEFVAGTYGSSKGFWLNAVVAVPEPAEWAVIFGALALGLAVYRRRK